MYLGEYGTDGMPLLRAFYWGYMMSSCLTTGDFVIDHMDEVECLLGFSTIHHYFPFVSNKCLGQTSLRRCQNSVSPSLFCCSRLAPKSLQPDPIPSELFPTSWHCKMFQVHLTFFFCSSPEINHFNKESWFLWLGNDVYKPKTEQEVIDFNICL